MGKIAVVGESIKGFIPHEALNQSLIWLGAEYEWVDTQDIYRYRDKSLSGYTGIWSAPGSPFKSLEGAIFAIEYARQHDIPHLGTCAGFQHMVIEFARNILRIKEAQHEEYNPNASILFISRLTCSLAGKRMSINITEGSKAFSAYQVSQSEEEYYCNFGVNPQFVNKLYHSDLIISAVDANRDIRIIEYPLLRFFVGTLFVPQTRSSKEKPHPLIKAFVSECMKNIPRHIP